MNKLLFLLVLIVPFSAFAVGGEVKLNWEYKQTPDDGKCENYAGDYFARGSCDGGSIKIYKAKTKRDRIEFEAIIHNNHDEYYQCFYMTTSENHVHIDDELGDEYKGLTLQFKNGQDNKLALNQRKKIKIIIPKPVEDVSLANIHFGFYFNNVNSGDSCEQPLGNHGINFHKLDWDISELFGG